MRVFVAGSTGVLGRSVVRQLCARGYEVVGLVRSQEKARLVQELGAEPVVGDILDVGSLRRAVAWSDAIMHLATAIPKKARPWGSDWAMNDRVRCEGTRNLIEAAQGNRIQAFVLQSVAFMYGDRRGQWIGEEETP